MPFIAIAVIAILVPALAEEMVFRVVLAGRTGWLRAGLALAAFVLWHPVQVWLGLPMAQPVFLEPAFLVIVAALGVVCTVAYRTSGAVWPPVAIHWGTVVLWKAVAAG
ncbi:MAG: CPBP family glutamic-type intramembrane protease [Pseudomonadota bacterium]|nr:CPBP family glutamic-type intramembrane protease [Pseudomonadota bacterium]